MNRFKMNLKLSVLCESIETVIMTFEPIQIQKTFLKDLKKNTTQNIHKPSKDYFQLDTEDFIHAKSFSAR